MPSFHAQLDKFGLGVIPNPLKLARALMRADEPFVMINILSYKEQATGDFAHLTGEEAYTLYAQSVQKAQAPLGSRLLWSGQVQQRLTEGNGPTFHSIGLLEYASPRAFLQFLAKGGSNTRARSAGLNGQWLIASTTLDEGRLPDSNEDHRVLVELIGGMKRNPEADKAWHELRESTYPGIGAKTLWHGCCDQHVLGTATPRIEDALVTWFPNAKTLNQVLGDPKRNDLMQSMRPYVAYIATSMVDFLPAPS